MKICQNILTGHATTCIISFMSTTLKQPAKKRMRPRKRVVSYNLREDLVDALNDYTDSIAVSASSQVQAAIAEYLQKRKFWPSPSLRRKINGKRTDN